MIYAENILLCITIPLLIALLFVRNNARRFVAAFLIGMGVCLLSAYINGFISLTSGHGAEDTAIFISPMVEEIMKLLPILFFLLMFEPKDESLTVFVIGLCTGFATFENCCYILTSGAERLTYVLIRGLAVGVMHVVCGIAVNYGLMMARRYRVLSFPSVTGALALPMIFHALYNLLVSERGVTSAVGYALPLVTAFFMYLPYRKLHADKSL